MKSSSFRAIVVFVGLYGCLALAFAQTPLGKWKTIDDESGKERSIVELWQGNDGKIYGSIRQIITKLPSDTETCTKCTGILQNKPIIGLQIVSGMAKIDGMWKGGYITDPKNGNVYKCEMYLEGADKLKLKGFHWTGLYRSQTWYRIKA